MKWCYWRSWGFAGLGAGLILCGLPLSASAGVLEIHVINVQQGASALVVGPDGTTVLLDAGDTGKGTGEIVPYLRELGLMPGQALDYTLMSHLHTDHIGGFDEVIAAGYDVREANWYNAEVELPLPENAPSAIQQYFDAAAATTAPGGPLPIPLGHRVPLGDGAMLTVVATAGEVLGHGFVPGAELDENDLSVAILIQYGEFDFIWAGDLGGGDDDQACTGRTTDQVNLETPLAQAISLGGAVPLLSADGVEVMHVNHHGSASSTNSDWMNLLRPQVAIIPVGAHKGYGHPKQTVVDNVLLAKAGCVTSPPALVLQTDEGHSQGSGTSFSGYVVGDVKITTDGGSSYRIEASGDIRGGDPEWATAGLPRQFCLPTETALCLNDDRFQVTVQWRTVPGTTGPGMAVPLTDDTGLFWFFNAQNIELVVKVLDACVEPFNHFWVFAGGLTNVEVTITVLDTETGASRVYLNPLRQAFQPIQDTAAFDCDPEQPPVADFTSTCVDLGCQFEDESSDPDGTIEQRSWSFGDGSFAGDVPSPFHTYANGGSYAVTLTVTDDDGLTDNKTRTVTVPSVEPGAVVLSEVFYDATGSDDGLEWVELFNAGDTTVDLSGYSLGNGGGDYTYSKVQLAGLVGPGETFVVGGPTRGSANGLPVFDQAVNFEPDFQNSGDHGDGVALFDKPTFQVSASTVPIDAVVYGPDNANGLIDETGAANPPEVGDAPAGSSIVRMTLSGTWAVRVNPDPNAAPGLE